LSLVASIFKLSRLKSSTHSPHLHPQPQPPKYCPACCHLNKSLWNAHTSSPYCKWRAPKSRGETHLRAPQNQVVKSWDLEARSRLPTLERSRGSSWEPRD
jgi:hypothetical protein